MSERQYSVTQVLSAFEQALAENGLVIVPRVPTKVMINAAPNLCDVDFYPTDIWKAMMEAVLTDNFATGPDRYKDGSLVEPVGPSREDSSR